SSGSAGPRRGPATARGATAPRRPPRSLSRRTPRARRGSPRTRRDAAGEPSAPGRARPRAPPCLGAVRGSGHPTTARRPSSAPAAAPAPAGTKKVDVTYVEWGEDERWMNASVNKFNEENPDINLIHQVEPGDYLAKLVARFRAGVKTDVPQVRDNQFAAWADA